MRCSNAIKKVFSILLVLVMAFSMIPVSVFAVDDTTIEDTTVSETTEVPEETEPEQAEEYTLTVNVTGNATVKINGESKNTVTVETGTKVKVEILLGENAYFASLSESDFDADKDFVKTITVTDNYVINATVKNYYVVSVLKNEGGTVKLDGKEVESLKVKEGTEVSYSIEADAGYAVSSVTIGSGSNAINELKKDYSGEITVNKNSNISVSFTKVFSVTVSYDSKTGTASVDSKTVNNGDVTFVKTGNDFTVTAKPNKNYRVETIKKNGQDIEFKAENNKGYTETVSADKDYTFEFTFAPNKYSVSVSDDIKNGSVSVSATTVNHGDEVVITAMPNDGYDIDEIIINGSKYSGTISDDYRISVSVTEDIVVSAKFVEYVKETTLDGIKITPAPVIDGNKYYFNRTNKSITVAADSNGKYKGYKININDEKSGTLIKTLTYRDSWNISSDTAIKSIKLKKSGRTTDIDLTNNAVNIIFDSEIDSVSLSPEELGEGLDCYSNDVKFAVSSTDKLSGIKSVKYTVKASGVETVEETLYSYNNVGNNENFEKQDAIVISAEKYNQKEVTVTVTVEDMVGNTKSETKTIKINTIAPSFVWYWNEKLDSVGTKDGIEDGISLFNKTRELKVDVTDWSKSFNAENAKSIVKVTCVTNGTERTIVPSVSNQTIVYNLAADGQYTFTFNDYTNTAGKSYSAENVESIEDFIVDTTAAKATIGFEGHLWDKLVEKLGFEVSENKTFKITVDAEDENGIKSISYYDPHSPEGIPELYEAGKTLEDKVEILNGVDFADATGIDIETEQRNVVYAKIVDNADNVLYISTDGFVLDMTIAAVEFGTYPEGYDKTNFYGSSFKDTNFELDVIVNDNTELSSGIKTIKYWITKTSDKAVFDKNNPEHIVSEESKKALYVYSGDSTLNSITDASKLTKTISEKYNNINGECVVFHVEVTDNAGNSVVKDTSPIIVNTETPVIKVEFDDQDNKTPLSKNDDYYSKRVATVTILDMSATFDAECVKIKFNPENKGANYAEPIIEWKGQTAEVTFERDANYTFTVDYTNKADSSAKQFKESFTIDNADPTGSIKIDDNIWDKFLSVITFGLYKNKSVDVTASGSDVTSAPTVLEYFIDYENTAIRDKESLDKEIFTKYTGEFSLSNDRHFTIYLKVTDLAGNYIYVSSDGYVVDNAYSEITVTPLDGENEVGAFNSRSDVYGYYNAGSDVKVKIDVEEMTGDYSGIKKIYYVLNDEETQHLLYEFGYSRDAENGNETDYTKEFTEFDVNNITEKNPEGITVVKGPTYDSLKKSWQGTIDIDKEKYNSSETKVTVYTEDNAGNTNEQTVILDIDITAPVIDVKYDETKNDGALDGYYTSRTATVTITERTNHFDPVKATQGITINAKDIKDTIKYDCVISDWTTTVNDESPDKDVHVLTIQFKSDANYEVSMSYTDDAGNKAQNYSTEFTKDSTNPDFGEITAKSKEGRELKWQIDYFKDLSIVYGFWSKSLIKISAEGSDAISPIQKIEYYKHVTKASDNNKSEVLSREKLDSIDATEWSEEPVELKPNVQCVIYAKVTDNAGNYSYVNTNGLIVDDERPGELLAPEITINPEQPINGIYSKDVKVSISVEEPVVGDTYSGLKSITYRIMNMTNPESTRTTKEGTLFSTESGFTDSNILLNNWKGDIIVDSKANNSNRVIVELTATDNSGNFTVEHVELKIDITKPTINVSYDNNSALNGKYFMKNRVATVVVTERNFDPDNTKIEITNTDGVMPQISKWVKSEGTGNGDNTKWTAKISYAADGDYTFKIKSKDLAGNNNAVVNYGKSVAATEFTIDKTIPTVSVTYNNNAARNGKYFNASRTATIVINEHNFNSKDVNISISANLDSKAITKPTATWSHRGDIHTATIHFSADGDYTFDVSVTDMAGNKSKEANFGNSAAGKAFTIDTKIVKPKIGGIEKGKAYKDDVIPTISFEDINFDSYEVKLLRTRKDEKNVDVTKQFINAISTNGRGGSNSNNTFEKKAENDGIYTLSVNIVDKAGNKESESTTFTVNRFGSVYAYSDYLYDLIKDGGSYVKEITDDLVITEYNADKLVSGSLEIEVTRDGKPLDKVDYTVSPVINDSVSVGSSGWYQYSYTVSKSNFEDDGVYKITVASKDATGNMPENSNYEDKGILFRVDSSAPEITSIVGLEKKIINATEVAVKYTIYDTIGLKSITVYVDGKIAGEVISSFEDANNYTGEVVISENSEAQKIRFVVEDIAGNVTDTDEDTFTSEYIFENTVTVSTNIFVRWYANKALFWGSISGVVIIAAAIWIFIAIKRKKNKKEA